MSTHSVVADLWARLGGPSAMCDAVEITGPGHVLPSVYDVTGCAAAAVATASLAVAELAALRSGGIRPAVTVDTVAASAAFRSERLIEPAGWTLPPLWDVIAGEYRTEDGWIRLHTNYRHHRRAALGVLGAPEARPDVAAAVARWPAEALQEAIVEAGGCAAVLHSPEAWAAHPHGRAAIQEPPVSLELLDVGGHAVQLADAPANGASPLSGVRVLDLSRVISGPVGTRFLAAYGADVLRVDPPGFEEMAVLLPDTTAGKRCAFLDLGVEHDRLVFEQLVREAHVLVHGLRPSALADRGYDPARLRELNPALISATLNAYGWSGPWSGRRGFDSLVQVSCGIAAEGARRSGSERPVPLPAQALDHATGYLLAAGVCRALTWLLSAPTIPAISSGNSSDTGLEDEKSACNPCHGNRDMGHFGHCGRPQVECNSGMESATAAADAGCDVHGAQSCK